MEGRVVDWKALHRDGRSPIEICEAIREESNRIEAIKREKERIERFISKVPYRFRDKSFDDYGIKCNDQGRVKKIAFRYASTFKDRLQDGVNLLFCGKAGTGKTYLSLILFQEIVKAGFSAQYESSLLFLQDLIELKFRSKADFENRLDSMIKTDFLIIDEITESINAHGKPSEIEKNLLLKIVNARYENKRATLAISNRDEDGMIERLGLPIYGRLKEGGLLLAFNWETYRN